MIIQIEDIFEIDSIIINEIIYSKIKYNTIIDTLEITQTITNSSPNATLTTRSGGYIEVKDAQFLNVDALDFNNQYRISVHVTYIITDTSRKITEFKRFLNYYGSETIFIRDYRGSYEAKLDYSDVTRNALYMFRDDTTITINFYAIKVG